MFHYFVVEIPLVEVIVVMDVNAVFDVVHSHERLFAVHVAVLDEVP